MSIDHGLGPLPRQDSNARLQERSLTAFRSLLRDLPFQIRDERILDYGVDLSLEAVVGGCPTNFRSQVQVKAVSSLVPNSDGTRSKSVETSNLNYLLNGTTPLYVLYVADEEAFYGVFAADARRDIERTNSAWMDQGTVTIHFRERLEGEKLNAIHERILKEARWMRETHDRLAAATNSESVSISICPETLQTQDANEAYRILIQNGLTIVTNGLAKDALRLIDLLDFDRKLGPRIQLVAAYAWYSLGRPQHALAAAAETTARFLELQLADQGILLEIRDAAECITGRITRDEYVDRLSQHIDPATGIQRDDREVDRLRFMFLAQRERTGQQAVLQQLTIAVGLVLKSSAYSMPYKLQARVDLAYCEGCFRSGEITQSLSVLRFRRNAPLPWLGSGVQRVVGCLKAYAAWEQQMQSLVAEAVGTGIPLLCAEALRTRLVVRTFILWGQRFASRFLKIGDEPRAEDFAQPIEDAFRAIAGFKQAGHLYGQLKTEMHLADLYELEGNGNTAKEIAAKTLPIARAIGMQDVVAAAEAHLAGKALMKVTDDGLLEGGQIDQDIRYAELTETELDRYATYILEAHQLPSDRRTPVRVDVGSYRYTALQRLTWCRSMELVQDLAHTAHPHTAYIRVPTYYGRCNRHGYESLAGACDYQSIVDKFKAAFCAGCRDRSPKRP